MPQQHSSKGRILCRLSAVLCAFSLYSHPVFSGQDDFNQPIKVDARSQFVDGKNKISIFKGDVNISQGSLEITADEVEVDASAGEGKEVFIARGQPAQYAQILDDGQRVTARAEEIRYQVAVRTISLDGDAELLREGSSVAGNSIVYDMTREQLVAESSNENNGRVTTVFRPDAINQGSKDTPIEEPKEEDEKEQEPPEIPPKTKVESL